jgi:hypothetical protein
MGEPGLRLRRSHWARDGTALRLCTLPSGRAHVYPGVQDLEQHWMAVPTPREAPAVLAAYPRVPSRAREPATDQ